MLTIDVLHQHRVKNAGKTLWGDPCEKRWTEVGPWCGLHGGAQGSSYHARHRRCCGGMEPTEPCEEDEEQLGEKHRGRKKAALNVAAWFIHIKLPCFFVGGGGDEIIPCQIVHWNFDMWVLSGDDIEDLAAHVFGAWPLGCRGGDCILEVNGITGNVTEILEKCKADACHHWVILFDGKKSSDCNQLTWSTNTCLFFDGVKHDFSCIFRFLCFFYTVVQHFFRSTYSNM